MVIPQTVDDSRRCKAVFEKALQYSRAAEVASAGFQPYFRQVETNSGVRWMVEGEEKLVACSNDYLGLACDERVKAAARRALDRYGTSCTGSRFLTGTLVLHDRLEEQLAEFLQVERVLTFSTGFLGCLSALSALGGRKDILYFDRENHASLYDGSRLAFSKLRKYRHNDMEQLEHLLERDSSFPGGRLIVTDGVFSMSGHIAPLGRLVELADRFNAGLLVDDAHATGVLGKAGRGTAEHLGLDQGIDLVVGTFSKAFGSVGGFLAGDMEVIDYIRCVARPFIFTAALPGMQIAATTKALELIQRESWRREKLQQNVEFYRQSMHELGFDTLGSETPIVPVLIGEESRTFRFWQGLWDAGIFTSPAIPPGVPEGQCIVRTSITARHSHDDIEEILIAFERVGRSLGVI